MEIYISETSLLSSALTIIKFDAEITYFKYGKNFIHICILSKRKKSNLEKKLFIKMLDGSAIYVKDFCFKY